MMRKMVNKKSTSQESLSGECTSTQEVQGIIVDCDTILNDAVDEKLRANWSPEQIAGRIRLEYPEDQSMRIRPWQQRS